MICLGILRQMTTTKRGASKNTTPFMQRIEYWVIYVALSYIKLNVRDNIIIMMLNLIQANFYPLLHVDL